MGNTTASTPTTTQRCQLVVIGAGPGGYTAAFRAADLGLDVVLIERYPALGGVCLNVGCIPSKALLHTAAVIQETKHMSAVGVTFAAPKIDVDALRAHKDKVVGTLTKGLAGMAKQRKVRVITGAASFASPHALDITTAEGTQRLAFERSKARRCVPSAVVMSSACGEAKLAAPVMTRTLRCLAIPAKPLVSVPTTLSLWARSASTSIFGAAKVTPTADMCLVSWITAAVCSRAFEGMQPTFKHTPPSAG